MASRQRKSETKIHKRHWYHVSEIYPYNNNNIITLIPYPIDEYGEPRSKRICVAPTIYQCLLALQHRGNSTGYIYRTIKSVKAREAYSVCDSEITDEHWIKSPTRFKFVGKIENIYVDLPHDYNGTETPEELIEIKDKCRRRVRTARWKSRNNAEI